MVYYVTDVFSGLSSASQGYIHSNLAGFLSIAKARLGIGSSGSDQSFDFPQSLDVTGGEEGSEGIAELVGSELVGLHDAVEIDPREVFLHAEGTIEVAARGARTYEGSCGALVLGLKIGAQEMDRWHAFRDWEFTGPQRVGLKAHLKEVYISPAARRFEDVVRSAFARYHKARVSNLTHGDLNRYGT